jgi:hypothetical protein
MKGIQVGSRKEREFHTTETNRQKKRSSIPKMDWNPRERHKLRFGGEGRRRGSRGSRGSRVGE